VIFPPRASLTLKAASTAFSSKGLITGGTPAGGVTLLEAVSTLKLAGGASGSITCLQQTIMFTANRLLLFVTQSIFCGFNPSDYFIT
jgi:hypothetical protein